jgi:hypothetical protein
MEKFYNYVEWLEYLINVFLKPRGYVLEGCVRFFGEETEDMGYIEVKRNKVKCHKATSFT